MPQNDTSGVSGYARARDLSINYVYRMIYEGRLDAQKVDGEWRIPAQAEPRRKRRPAGPGSSA